MATKNKSKPAASDTKSKNEGVSNRSLALGTLSAGAVVGAIAAGIFGLLKLGKDRYTDGQPIAPGSQPKRTGTPKDGPEAAAGTRSGSRFGSGEHTPTDLMGDHHPAADERAPNAFRPDPTAPVPQGERDALRPALAGEAAPTLVKGQSRGNARVDATPS